MSVGPNNEVLPARRDARSLVTERLRVLLEKRIVRFAVVVSLLAIASLMARTQSSVVFDFGWIFLLPVSISAIASGIREGMFVAFVAAAISGLLATLNAAEQIDPALLAGAVSARFALFGLNAALLGAFSEAHRSAQYSLRRVASLDPLTKTVNAAGFYHEVDRLARARTPFTVMLVKVDSFTHLNDRYGHQAGSSAIKSVAGVLRKVVRASDLVARYSGDEFAVVLAGAGSEGAEVVVRRVGEMLQEESIAAAPDEPIVVKIGFALSGEHGSGSEELLAAAARTLVAERSSARAPAAPAAG